MKILPMRDSTLAQGQGDFFPGLVDPMVVVFSDESLISRNLD